MKNTYLDKKGLETAYSIMRDKGMKYIFHGTQEEWVALTPEEQNEYDQAEIVDNAYLSTVGSRLTISNVVLAPAQWEADTTYPEYPFRYSVTMLGVTDKFSPDVRLNLDTLVSGIICPIADCTDDTIYLYAASRPTELIDVPCIICDLVEV